MHQQNPPILFLIADYGGGDPAFAEVILRLHALIPNCFIERYSTPPFSTLNAGFWINQIASAPEIKNVKIFCNVAPRKDKTDPRVNNAGESLVYARLKNGFEILAVNSGYVFSFVKPLISKFNLVKVSNSGSQFRSRDNYPDAVAKLLTKDLSLVGKSIPVSSIEDVPKNEIAHIDGYGNIKTTTRLSQITGRIKDGSPLYMSINGKTQAAIYTTGIFHVKEGEMSFAPGSSGHSDKFMEISLRGGSAWKSFSMPAIGDEVKYNID